MATFPTLNAQTAELLHAGKPKEAQAKQGQADLLASWPQEAQDLYWATRNSKTVLDSDADDGAMMKTADQLKRILATAYHRPELASLPLRAFNEGNRDFSTGRDALQRMYDIATRSARADAADPKVQAAATIGEENREIYKGLDEALRHTKQAGGETADTDGERQAAAETFYVNLADKLGLTPQKPDFSYVGGEEIHDWIRQHGAAMYFIEGMPWTPEQDGAFLPTDKKDPTGEIEREAIRREAIAKAQTYVAQNAALTSYLEIADALKPEERELIRRAFAAGQKGLDIGEERAIDRVPTSPADTAASIDIDDAKKKYGEAYVASAITAARLSNKQLIEKIDPAHEEAVRSIVSMARGRVDDPQFLADMWTRLCASTDRTFGNIPKFISATAKDTTLSIGAMISAEDSYGNYSEQAQAEARRDALWDAATQRMTFEPGYGWFGDGLIGMIEQTPIWATLTAGYATSVASGGTIPGTQIAMGALAVGYAEDTRTQLLIDGADPLTALVGGIASGAVQSWIERAQAEALIGKGFAEGLLKGAFKDATKTVANAFYKRSLKTFGSWEFAKTSFRVGGGIALNGVIEAIEEGLQAGADRLISDLALADPSITKAISAGIQEFKDTLPTMMITAGFGGTVTLARDVARGASVGARLRVLMGQGRIGKEAEAVRKSMGSTMDYAAIREAWRNAPNDRARIRVLMDAGRLAKPQASALHAYLIAEEKIADRHDAIAMQMMVDMSNEGAKTFANDPKAIQRVLQAIGLRNVQVEATVIGTINQDKTKNEREGWAVTATLHDGATVTFTLGVMAAEEKAIDGSAATASSAWEFLAGVNATEIQGMTQEQFSSRWATDTAWRQKLVDDYGMARRGETLQLRTSPYLTATYTTPDGKTRKRKVSAAGAILLATGGHGSSVAAENKTLAHETLHAIVGLMRDTGVLTEATEGGRRLIQSLREVYGDPVAGAGELFNEERFADALMEEAGLGLEALERAAGEATRRRMNPVARALHGLADLFMGGGDFVLTRDGLDIREGADRSAAALSHRHRDNLAILLPFAKQAADEFRREARERSISRLRTLQEGIRERLAKRREQAEKEKEDEAQRQLRNDELAALVDSDLSEMAKEAHAVAEAGLNALRDEIEEASADIRRAFDGVEPGDNGKVARQRRANGLKLIARWRALKTRELEMMHDLADLNVDPDARRAYLIARENEAHRLNGRAVREALDAEKRRINETPVTTGDALLANTRAIGHVEVESRERYITRKMKENGWSRKTAIAQATHLYPEDMQGLRAPWANRNLYTGKGGHSPDTAAQALYDDGRIADPTVDAFWDAVRGDIEVIGKAKQRDIDAAEAETASALEWGKQRHLQTLAAIEMQDEWGTGLGMGEARSSIVGTLNRETARDEMEKVRKQYEGTDQWMNAPNGKPTKLTRRQWLQVRTPSFKAWFGDWENDPETIHPKLLDENGEPRVFWHNSPAADIRAFDPARSRAAMDIQGTYFSPDSQDAAGYGQNAYPVFIALKHPADQATAYAGFTPGSSPDAGAVRAQELRDQGYDGVIVEDSDYDSGIAEVIVLDPRVIKSATDNRGSFDPANPDIRSSIGGGYLDDWSVRAQDAFNRGMKTEAQIAEQLGIPYGAWITNRPFGSLGEDAITGVLDENGRDIRTSDLLDFQSEWHHVGKRFDEVLFLDPDQFYDVRSANEIDDKQDAALFFYYTKMRQAPREIDARKLTAEELDALNLQERDIWKTFGEKVTPARDAFVRAIAADAEVTTLRALAADYEHAMREHKRLADGFSKRFLSSIGKPRAFRIERPRKAGNARYSIGGLYSGGPVAYAKPSLRAVGSNDGGSTYGWGLYANADFAVAKTYTGTKNATLARRIAVGGVPIDEQEGAVARIVRRALLDPNIDARALSTETLRAALERNEEDIRKTFAVYERSGKNPRFLESLRADIATYEEIAKRGLSVEPAPPPAIHEQLWWAHRAPGDETHLLDWDKPLSTENRARLLEVIDSLGLDPSKLDASLRKDWRTRNMKGKNGYQLAVLVHRRLLENFEGDPEQAASALLYAHGIDGVKAETPSGTPTYVSFSDEHLQVTRRWLWNAQTQAFELDRSFTPPPPTEAEARSSIGGFGLSERARDEMDEVSRQYEGTDQWMNAPNGNPTNLTEEQWLQVRTPSFKAWFGDWENDPANASKVVDGNGEPLVVYHGTNADPKFYQFSHKFSMRNGAALGRGFYFSEDKSVAEGYGNDVIPVFLNIKKPLEPAKNKITKEDLKRVIRHIDPNGDTIADYASSGRGYPGKEWYERSLDEAVDAIFSDSQISDSEILGEMFSVWGGEAALRGVVEVLGYDGFVPKNTLSDDVKIAFLPEQIKSATENVGTFSPANPDIRSSIGGVNPTETSARQKDAHGIYPDASEDIARASIGARRQAEYRAIIAKHRPNLPQEEADRFMDELGKLGTTKAEKTAIHWFVRGALELPEDSEKLKQALSLAEKFKLDPLQFDSPLALAEEADRRNQKKQKLAYVDPDTVPELTNKRDLGHGVVVYDVEDSPRGQAAMRRIMNSHLGRDAKGDYWSPWCLLTPTVSGGVSESAKGYWKDYNKSGRGAAFYKGRLVAFQSSKKKKPEWWDLKDNSHGESVPIPPGVRKTTPSEIGVSSDKVPADLEIAPAWELLKSGELHPLLPAPGTRGSADEGIVESWYVDTDGARREWIKYYTNGVLSRETSFSSIDSVWAKKGKVSAETFYQGNTKITTYINGIRETYVNGELKKREYLAMDRLHENPFTGEPISHEPPTTPANTAQSLQDLPLDGDLSRSSIAGRETLRLPRETEADAQDPRSALGSIERGARAASLYFGRAPAYRDLTTKTLAEAALFAAGKRQTAKSVREAYQSFGVNVTPEAAAVIADRINDDLKEQAEALRRRAKGEQPRDRAFGTVDALARAYDANWAEAQKEAFEKGVSGTFGAARQMAEEAQELAEAARQEAEAVTGTAPAVLEVEMGFDIEATLLAAPEQVKTPMELEKSIKKAQEELDKAAEEAARAEQLADSGAEHPIEELGFTESKLAELQKRRRELRERLRKLERERERLRKEAKKKFLKKETNEKQNAEEDEKNYRDYCERLRVTLNGVAFDLDDAPSVREFVNLVILHTAERRAGHEIKKLQDLRTALRDPLVVRDAARTLAQIADDIAKRLAPSAARELIAKKAMTLATAETIGQARALATGALLSIRNVRIRQGRTELRDAMVKMIDSVAERGRFAVGKEDSDRKVGGDLERWLDDIRRALLLGDATLEQKRWEAMDLIAGLSGRVRKGEALESFRNYQDAMRTVSAIDRFGNWRRMSLGELDDLRAELERMVNGGIEAHEIKMRQMKARIDGFLQPLLDALTQNPTDFKPDENAPLRERIANALDRNLGLQSLLFEALLARSTGETRAKAQRAVRDLLNAFSEASAKYEATLITWRKRIQQIAERHYGSTGAFMRRMHETVPEHLRDLITHRRTDNQAQEGRDARQRTRITYGQALQLYASIVQRDYTENARIHHRDGASFAAVRACLTDADIAFVAECSAFMREIFPELRDTYAEVTGVTVGTTPDYWPVRINYERDGLGAEVRAWTPIVAAMEPRRRNGLDFKEDLRAEQMLFSRLNEWARMLAYGRLGIVTAAVFGNRDLKQAITNAFGEKMQRRIEENVKTALMGPDTKADNAIILSTRWASAFAMSGNVGVAFKQGAGAPAFALKLGAKETIKAWWGGIARDGDYDADWTRLTQSDAFRARYGGAGLNAEMRAALQGATPGALAGATAKAYDLGFRIQSIADRIVAKPFAIGAYRHYREAYLREGLPQAEAERRAVTDAWALVEDTQQSARPENQFDLVNRSRVVRMLVQFRAAPLQQLQYEMRAWAAFLRGEEGAKQKLARVIFINHILSPIFWVAFDAAWQAIIGLFGPGDEDEEKMEARRERRIKRWLMEIVLGATTGQLAAVPALGGAIEATYNAIVDNIARKREEKETRPMSARELATAAVDIPAVRTAADIAAATYNIGIAAAQVEPRDIASEADDLLKTAVPLYRDASKAAEQWGLGDLDNLWEEED